MLRCRCALEGDCGEEGRAVADAALIESRLNECESDAVLFVDGGNGADDRMDFESLFCNE